MNRRGFFATLAAAIVGPPAAGAIAPATPPFMCAPDYIADMDCWESPNAQPLIFLPSPPLPPLIFHREAFSFTWPPLELAAPEYVADPETGILRKA